MKVSDGFSMADSRNLPKVDFMMLLQFMRENDIFNVAEIRGAKIMLSSRDAYVETSIGYVEVKRENSLCFVQGRVTPEHRVRCKMYTVHAVINEIDDTITEVSCHDCAASEGGCKHSICFIMWLIKRTEEPSVTSINCYWSKPRLYEAVSDNKFIMAKEIGVRKHPVVTLPPSLQLPLFINECKKRKMNDSLIINYNITTKDGLDKYTIFQLMLEYTVSVSKPSQSFQNFKDFAESKISLEVISAIEEQTRHQAENVWWHNLKQSRVSASKIYEASRCKIDGVLVKSILGGYKVPETKAIKRGKILEKKVINEIEKEHNVKINKCGFKLITPLIGASPDGICHEKNFVVEVKCPYSDKALENYMKEGKFLNNKYKAQIQLQMHAMNMKKALFCIADKNFEENKKMIQSWHYYDRLYVEKLLLEGEEFWKKFIFEKMLSIVQC